MSKQNFHNAYEAGYDAGLNGANTENSHHSWFSNEETMKEWQRGNNDGSYQKKMESSSIQERIRDTHRKTAGK